MLSSPHEHWRAHSIRLASVGYFDQPPLFEAHVPAKERGEVAKDCVAGITILIGSGWLNGRR